MPGECLRVTANKAECPRAHPGRLQSTSPSATLSHTLAQMKASGHRRGGARHLSQGLRPALCPSPGRNSGAAIAELRRSPSARPRTPQSPVAQPEGYVMDAGGANFPPLPFRGLSLTPPHIFVLGICLGKWDDSSARCRQTQKRPSKIK